MRAISLVLASLLPLSQISANWQQTATAAASRPSGPVLEDGTPVKLRISQTVSSADAHVGQTVDFEVLEEVKVNNVVVVPKGGYALATVTEAQSKRRLGRGGKLNINIDHVRLADGEKAALRAIKDVKGGGHQGAMTGAIVATSLVFFPAAPLFLFMHGKDITIPKGTEVTAFVNGNLPLDLSRFQAGNPSPGSTATVGTTSILEISSTPDGADIELDGSYVGSTPSSLSVPSGEHSLKISKAGFGQWEKKIKTLGGTVRVAAELAPTASTPQ